MKKMQITSFVLLFLFSVYFLTSCIYLDKAKRDMKGIEQRSSIKGVDDSFGYMSNVASGFTSLTQSELPTQSEVLEENESATPTSELITDNFVLQVNSATIKAGETLSQSIILKSTFLNIVQIDDIVVDMVTSNDLSVFPFRINQGAYRWVKGDLQESENGFSFGIELVSRGDALQNYYDIPFVLSYSYKDEDGNSHSRTENLRLPVLVTTSSTSSTTNNSLPTSAPKVYISDSSSTPQEVIAGNEFSLSITIRNPSTELSVQALKVQMITTDQVITPISGSSTFIVDEIRPQGSVTKTIQLNSRADAVSGNYSVQFVLSYDYTGSTSSATDTEIVSVSINQIPELQVGQIQIAQNEVYIGQPLNISTSVNNTGKTMLYNVQACFLDSEGHFKETELFLGNIEPGNSARIDAMLQSLLVGESDIKLVISYEDENGSIFECREGVVAYVVERSVDDEVIEIPMPSEDGGGMTFVYIVLSLLIVAAVVTVFLIKIRKPHTTDDEDEIGFDLSDFKS